MAIKFAIEEFIDKRSQELGLRPVDLIRRTTYKNEAKGLRRLSALCSGDLSSCQALISSLPRALDVSVETLEGVLTETRRQLIELDQQQQARDEAAWRASFRPHAIIVTERTVPQPIFIAALIGVDRILRIDFDDISKPITFIDQALAGIRRKIEEFGGDFASGRSQLPCVWIACRSGSQLQPGCGCSLRPPRSGPSAIFSEHTGLVRRNSHSHSLSRRSLLQWI